MKKSALITGGKGFIGTNLVKNLLSHGWSITALVRKSATDLTLAFPEGVELIVDDQATDLDGSSLTSALKRTQPDVVFHLASLFLATHSSADIPRLIESNVLFGTRLLEAINQAGLTRFVNTGTAWQHFEDKNDNPVNLYAATKSAFEAVLAYYNQAAGMSTITLKLYDTYGEGDPRAKLVHLLIKTALTKEHLAMSPGEQKIDLVHVSDVVEAFRLAGERLLATENLPATSKPCFESFTVSSGQPIKLRDLVGVFESATNTKLNIGWGERPYRDREVMIPFTKHASVPGWAPKVELKDGLRSVYAATVDATTAEPKSK